MTGLQKQLMALDFGQGVDTKTDPKLVQPGKLTELKNGVFKRGKSISKRFGYDVLSSTKVDGSAITSGDSGATFNNELLLFSAQKVFSYSEATAKWIDKGSCVSLILNTKQIAKNTAAQSQPDSAIINGVSLYAWEDSRGGVRASVFDETTGTPLVADTSVDGSASRPRCLAFGGYLFVFYYRAGSLRVKRLSPLTPTTFDPEVVISSTVNTTDPTYDITLVNPTTAAFAHNVQGAAQIKLGIFDVNPTVSTTAIPVTIAEAGTNAIGLVIGPGQRIYLAYHNGTNGLRCTIRNNGLAVLYAPFTVDATTSPIVKNITGYSNRDNSGVTWFYHVNAAATYNHFVKTNTTSTSGVAGTATVFARGVGLQSKAWVYYSDSDSADRAYVGLVHDSELQATYFIARNDGLIVGKMQPGLAYGQTPRNILANVNSLSESKFSFSIANKTQLISENASLFSLTGVASATLDFTNSQVYNYAQLGDNLHIVGGVLSIYDGDSVVEHGFHLYPENVTLAESIGGSLELLGVYQYVAVYEWTDNAGQRHQSAPSPAASITLTGSNDRVTVTVPTLRLTAKKNNRTNVVISLYRTEDLGTTFYKVTSVASPNFNDTTVDTISIVDDTDDADLISNQLLYTTGDILENASAPAASTITVFKNRIILAGLENENEFWYSKQHVKGEPVSFAAEFSKTLEPEGGGLTATWALDDKLILFKTRRAYYTYGDGPTDTGQLNDFPEPEKINTDAGCSTFNSITDFPNGLIRKTEKGIYHMNGSLQDTYIGSDVEQFNSTTITSASLISDTNQIVFTTSDDVALVYDYFFGQWSTFTGHAANDGLVWKDQTYVFLKSNGIMLSQNTSAFKDASGPVPLKLTTAWISMAGVHGFQRVYRLLMLAEYKSNHLLTVRVGYDFNENWDQTIMFNPVTGLDVNTYGDGTYGQITPYGGATGAYRLMSRLSRQKCQAIRFQFEEVITSATSGTQEGLTIASMGLEIGVKSGATKLRAVQTVASSQGSS
jgi:hypothetical protein